MKTAIITGAGSFLGRAVAEKLIANGYELSKLKHSFDESLDVPLPEEADVWLHFAWAGTSHASRSDESIQEGNIAMSLKAFKKAMELDTGRFIFAGSQAEYGHAQDGGLKKEDGPTAPVSEYGKAKLKFYEKALDELASCRSDMQYIHMRIFSAYGPGDHEGTLINTLIDDLPQGRCISLSSCRQLWDYIYIDDLARAIVVLCERAVSGSYNVASGDIRPLREYILHAARILVGGKASRLLHFGERSDNAEGAADLSPDISRLKSLGFRPRVSFLQGLDLTLRSKGVKKFETNR